MTEVSIDPNLPEIVAALTAEDKSEGEIRAELLKQGWATETVNAFFAAKNSEVKSILLTLTMTFLTLIYVGLSVHILKVTIAEYCSGGYHSLSTFPCSIVGDPRMYNGDFTYVGLFAVFGLGLPFFFGAFAGFGLAVFWIWKMITTKNWNILFEFAGAALSVFASCAWILLIMEIFIAFANKT